MLENTSIVMKLSQEILCEIFSYLQDHPVHFNRVARVCRSWNFAADNHLYWRRLIKDLKLPDPKQRAYKYRTHKSIILKNWKKFCTLCDARRTRNNGLRIQSVLVDMTKIAKINFEASSWSRVVRKNPGTQEGQVKESAQFFNHMLCHRCHSIYIRFIREENIKSRRDLLLVKLEEFGIIFPPDNREAHDLYDQFVLYGEGNLTDIARELVHIAQDILF